MATQPAQMTLSVDLTDNKFILWLASLFVKKTSTIYLGFEYDSYNLDGYVFIDKSSLREITVETHPPPQNVVQLRRRA